MESTDLSMLDWIGWDGPPGVPNLRWLWSASSVWIGWDPTHRSEPPHASLPSSQ